VVAEWEVPTGVVEDRLLPLDDWVWAGPVDVVDPVVVVVVDVVTGDVGPPTGPAGGGPTVMSPGGMSTLAPVGAVHVKPT
jgi:hypothetical protein